MSSFEKIAIGKEVDSFDVSPQFDVYSGVVIVDSEGNEELIGTDTGRTITIPGITRAQAQAILADLTESGFQYQPYTASNAILSPAAELGDGVTINGTYSGIYKMSRNYSPLMAADIEAPQDEEIDHEYPYEPKQDRVYRREIAQAMTRISQTEDAITLEAERATDAEGVLRASIMQNATDITAKVSAQGQNATNSFSWSLDANGFYLYRTDKTSPVFKATSSGVEISGKITATSGYIGSSSQGFAITASAIYNGMNSINSASNGVYIGTNGIALGGGKFKVTSSGAVSAVNMTLTGTLNIGGTNITAAALRSGAQSAYNNGSTWSTGAGYGYNYNKATQNGTSSYPAYFKCGQITATGGLFLNGRFDWGGYTIGRTTIIDGNGNVKNVLGWQ